MVVKVTSIIFALVMMATLSGCQTDVERIEEQGRKVKACVDNGGEWYNNNDAFGATCHFDTRKDS